MVRSEDLCLDIGLLWAGIMTGTVDIGASRFCSPSGLPSTCNPPGLSGGGGPSSGLPGGCHPPGIGGILPPDAFPLGSPLLGLVVLDGAHFRGLPALPGPRILRLS